MEDELSLLEEKYKGIVEDENKAVVPQNESVKEESKQTNNLPSTYQEQTGMSNEQAKMIFDAAKNPKDFINIQVSSEINKLANNDKDFKQEIKNVAKDTTKTALQSFTTDNKKQQKQNFFELNEKDITPLGGDKTSSKGQQVSIVLIRRIFWILLMSTLGFFYIAPWTVMVELFQGITFKTIEKEEIVDGENKKTKHYITRTKLGKTGTVIGTIFGFLCCGVVAFATYLFPMVFLWIAVAVFSALLLINIMYAIRFDRLKDFVTKKNKSEETAKESEKKKNTTIEVEAEE